jgi:hypothetical protein
MGGYQQTVNTFFLFVKSNILSFRALAEEECSVLLVIKSIHIKKFWNYFTPSAYTANTFITIQKEILSIWFSNPCMEFVLSRFGLSRERVRQVGLIAMEKLKHAARRKQLNALLEDYWVEIFSMCRFHTCSGCIYSET